LEAMIKMKQKQSTLQEQ